MRALDGDRRGRRAGTGALLGGTQQQHVAGVRLRGVRLGVAGVAVVPDRGQAEVGHRCEHRRPGADDGPDRAAVDREPAAVALLGAGVGGEDDVPAVAEQRGQRRVHPGDGPPVGQHGERATPGGQGRGERGGQLPGQSGPGSAVHTARGGRPGASARR